MPVIDLLQEPPPTVILARLWTSARAFEIEEESVVDISDLTPELPRDAQGFAWVELPLLGAGGRITGVLCQHSRMAVPDEHPARSDEGPTREYVHDIANLLAVIDGGLRLLDIKTGAEDRATIVDRLHRAIERGASLSRRLLDAAKSDHDERAPARHDQVVTDIGDLLDRTLRADVVVDTEIDPCLRQFRVDPEELHLALLNLCKNSSDAMPFGGTISIAARNVYVRPDRPWVEISVRDEGTGMSPDTLERMFELYFTTKESGKGTGLGLDQVKRFVERSGGALAVESVEDQGTTVRMLFPCA